MSVSFGLNMIHDWHLFAALLPFFVLMNYGHILKTVLRAAAYTFIFTFMISLSYGLYTNHQGKEFGDTLLLWNLKVLSLSLLSFAAFKRMNIILGLSFSKNLSFIVQVAYSQIALLQNIFSEFHLVIKSRIPLRKLSSKRILFFLNMIEYFFHQTMRDAHEKYLAIDSRGFFLDDSTK